MQKLYLHFRSYYAYIGNLQFEEEIQFQKSWDLVMTKYEDISRRTICRWMIF